MLADPESVEEILNRQRENGSKPSIPLAGWTTEHDLLTTIIDVLNNLHATLIQVNDERGRRPDVTPLPRPSTALEKVEAKQAIEVHRRLVAMALPRQ